jgi:hydantoinase/carbamoylase family amidase
VSADALHGRLAQLAALGAWSGGIDRPLFTAPERAARELFARWAREAGLTLAQDRAGNLFARTPGDGPAILSGSHLDTVRTGGAYDGAYGVVAALGAIERLRARGAVTAHPLEVAAWAGEEGSRFPLGCLGSGVFAGLNVLADVESLQDANGVTFAAARDGADGALPGLNAAQGPLPAAYVEIHVEQGPVLERAGARLGTVSAIAGQARYALTVSGESGHAGTVPMTGRRDALVAASMLVLALEQSAHTVGDAVLTVGSLIVEPNQTNVIPGRVVLRVDARSSDQRRIAALGERLRAACAAVEAARGVTIGIELLEHRSAVAMSERLRAQLRLVLSAHDPNAIELPSGAGHDAMCIAACTPTAMIFVPSSGGKSHTGEEYTAPEDLELGIEALASALVAIDRATP